MKRISRTRHETFSSPCWDVWDAMQPCRGWQDEGHPLHGCELRAGHRCAHRCRCGDESVDPLPPPKMNAAGYRVLGFVDGADGDEPPAETSGALPSPS